MFCGIILFFFYNFVLYLLPTLCAISVVVATAKVRIFKQITTESGERSIVEALLLLPQRYEFSSKSQLLFVNGKSIGCCCCYRKGTNFQANHNGSIMFVRINWLLLLPQRYEFSSKSQQYCAATDLTYCCCCYRKGANFQANHNIEHRALSS